MAKSEELKPASSLTNMILLVGVGLIVVFLGILLYQVVLKDKLNQTKTSATNAEIASVVAKVGKLMVLPNEDVTLATVSDANKLANQPFFTHAQNGDKVLIYTASKKAILYRPSIDKIIEVGPISINQPSVSPADTAASSSSKEQNVSTNPLQVTILNGTTVAGLASTTKKTLAEKFPDYTYFMGDANNQYARTKVVDLTGKNASVAEKIAVSINGEVTKLPPGETKPNTDLLVIIGR